MTEKIWTTASDFDELEKNISEFSWEKKQQAYDTLLAQYLWDNKTILDSLNFDILADIDIIPEWFEQLLDWQIDSIKNVFKNSPKFNVIFNQDELMKKHCKNYEGFHLIGENTLAY